MALGRRARGRPDRRRRVRRRVVLVRQPELASPQRPRRRRSTRCWARDPARVRPHARRDRRRRGGAWPRWPRAPRTTRRRARCVAALVADRPTTATPPGDHRGLGRRQPRLLARRGRRGPRCSPTDHSWAAEMVARRDPGRRHRRCATRAPTRSPAWLGADGEPIPDVHDVLAGRPRRAAAVQRRPVELPARRRPSSRPLALPVTRATEPLAAARRADRLRARRRRPRQHHRRLHPPPLRSSAAPSRLRRERAMTEPSGFTLEVDQNTYLPEGPAGSTRSSRSTATGGAAAVRPRDTAPRNDHHRLLDVDGGGDGCSAARRATAAAIAQLRDGVAFAVIAGTATARSRSTRRVGHGRRRTRATRAEATAAVDRLRANGGTAIGTWLHLAGQIAEQHPDALRHAILLTDGQNGESAGRLHAALDAVRRPVHVRLPRRRHRLAGRRAAGGRLGAAGHRRHRRRPRRPGRRLPGDHGGGDGQGHRRRRAAASGRPRHRPSASSSRWRRRSRTSPASAPTSTAAPGDYPLGLVGLGEPRLPRVRRGAARSRWPPSMLAARGRAGAGGRRRGARPRADVLASGPTTRRCPPGSAGASPTTRARPSWPTRSRRAWPRARPATSHTATARLGRAVALADESGNDGTARLLDRVVDVLDAPSGTVRLRAKVNKADEMTLDTRSTKTVQVRGRA